MTHYVYILKCGDGTYYTGYTNSLLRRYFKQCAGKGAKYTRGRGPLEIVYWEMYETKSEALKREAAIKKLTRKNKLKLIETKTNL